MKRQRAIQKLSANRKQLNRFSVKDLYIFGSVARDESSDGSDMDILVEFQPDAKIGLFQFARLQRFLGELGWCANAIERNFREDRSFSESGNLAPFALLVGS
jgi:predicted nucleotidyltransferase